MRNLKRALSLALASVMVLGLMVVGTGASYADVTSEHNTEAIEVLQSVGIMVGDDNGNFNPEAKVTRNEMAVIMSNLMDYRVASYAGTSPFTDVPSWAEPYVAACYTNGITAGMTATIYGGDQEVTTAQAALMTMKALGYFQYQSDFASDWQLATVSQANKIDLFEDVDSGVREAMTRNDVAQLVLNTLEAGTVEADDNTIKVNTDGVSVEAGKVNYNFVTSSRDYASTIGKVEATSSTSSTKGFIVELGEKLYAGDLTKEESVDVFGRPANIWEYQAKEVGTYADEADYTFTAKVTSKALYNAIGKTATDTYNWSVSVDGEPMNTYNGKTLNSNKTDDDQCFLQKGIGAEAANRTGNGVLTQVYVNGTDKTVDIAVIHYYSAEVYKVNKDEGTITLSAFYGKAQTNDEFETADFEEDDIVMYAFANNEIQEVYAADRMEGEVTRVRTNTNDNEGDIFVADGTTYKYNTTMSAGDRLLTENVNNSVVGYMDAYGYVAYIDESAITYDYAYVLSVGDEGDKFGNEGDKGKTVYARLVLTDGTMMKVETDTKYSDKNDILNHIVSYSKDKNDVYTLTVKDTAKVNDKSTTDGTGKAVPAAGLQVENGVASIYVDKTNKSTGRFTANSNTVFIVADSDADSYDDYSFSIYTGVKNVPDIDGKAGTKVDVAASKEGVARVVYVEDADVSGAKDVIFVRAASDAKFVKDSERGNYYEVNAVVDGETTTLNVKEGTTAADKLVNNIDQNIGVKLSDTKRIVAVDNLSINADDLVTSVKLFDAMDPDDGDGWFAGAGTDKAEKEVVGLAGTGYAWDDEVTVVRYDYKGDFSVSRIGSIKDDNNDEFLAVTDNFVLNGVCIVEKDGGEDSSDSKLPEGTESTKVGKFTFVTNKANYVKNLAAVVIGGNEIRTNFTTAMGAAPAANYTFDYKVESNGVELESVTNKTVAAAAGKVTFDTTSGIFSSGEEYTITITNMSVDKYAAEVTSVPSGMDVKKASLSPADLAVAGGTLALNITEGVTVNDKANITFTVKNVKDVTVGADVESLGNGRYIAKGVTVSGGAVSNAVLFNNVKPDGKGAVQVAIESITDESANVTVNFVLSENSKKFATLTGTTSFSAAVGATTVDASSGSVLTLVNNVTKADVTYQVAGVTTPTTKDDFVNGAGGAGKAMEASVGIPAAVKGQTITVTVVVEPTEYTRAILIDGTGTVGVAEANIKFDGDRKTLVGDLTASGSTGTHYIVEMGGSKKVIAPGSAKISLSAGDFTLTEAELLGSEKLIIKVTQVLKVVTVADMTSADKITSTPSGTTLGNYTFTTTLESGFGMKDGDDWYVTVNSVLKVTVTYMNGEITSGKTDTVTVGATENTVTNGTLTFGSGNLTAKSATVKITTAETTGITVKGANA